MHYYRVDLICGEDRRELSYGHVITGDISIGIFTPVNDRIDLEDILRFATQHHGKDYSDPLYIPDSSTIPTVDLTSDQVADLDRRNLIYRA